MHWVLTKTGAKGLYNLINIEHFGKNSGQSEVSYDYLEICCLKLFCASMNYFCFFSFISGDSIYST